MPNCETNRVWVAPADCSAGAPTDPYVRTLAHTVLLAVDSLLGQSYAPPIALDELCYPTPLR